MYCRVSEYCGGDTATIHVNILNILSSGPSGDPVYRVRTFRVRSWRKSKQHYTYTRPEKIIFIQYDLIDRSHRQCIAASILISTVPITPEKSIGTRRMRVQLERTRAETKQEKSRVFRTSLNVSGAIYQNYFR